MIGRGRMIANTSTYNFIKENSATTVVVRTDYHAEFSEALQSEGIDFRQALDPEARQTLEIPDRTTDEIGALAFSTGVMLNELSLRQASLEDAFMEMTGDAVQYHAADVPVAADVDKRQAEAAAEEK